MRSSTAGLALTEDWRTRLEKNWSVAETPYPRKVIRLPEILSPEEVTRLIDAADSMFHRAMLMTLCATGARRAEVVVPLRL